MKYIKLLFLQGLLLFCLTSQINAQSPKKTSVKKTNSTTKPKSKPKEEDSTTPLIEKIPESFTAQIAGRYAKSLAKKMYYAIDFQEKKSDYSMSIKKWKAIKIGNSDTWKYLIKVSIRWQSGGSGWPTQWTDVAYEGIIMCDEFGCEPFFLVETKNEPAPGFLGINAKQSPLGEITQKTKDILIEMDSEWLSPVNYVFQPKGCLDE